LPRFIFKTPFKPLWIPAFAGMTDLSELGGHHFP
jgi:hypothetical protein